MSLTLSFPEKSSGITVRSLNDAEALGTVAEFDRNAMVALNTANLSIKSPQRRILERLVADGKLTGSIAGTPDVS